jgi:hypothetical protein
LRLGQILSDPRAPLDAKEAFGSAFELFEKNLTPQTAELMFFRGCCHAARSGLADQPGSNVSADQARADSDLAMQWILQAVDAGYTCLDAYRTESALDSLRDREDFRQLMHQLEAASIHK